MRALIYILFFAMTCSKAIAVVHFNTIAVNQRGVICGTGFTGTDRGHWATRCSQDGGKSWKWTDEFEMGDTSWGTTIRVGQQGEFYVVGSVSYSYEEGLIRVSRNDGQSWTTLDVVNQDSEQIGWDLYDFLSLPTGEFLTVGDYWGNSLYPPNMRWVVRRLSNIEDKWKNVEEILSKEFLSVPYSAAVDLNGSVYVAGVISTGQTVPPSPDIHSRWVVRKSEDKGLSWANSFLGDLEVNDVCKAKSIVASSSVYVSGWEHNNNLVTRKSDDDGKTWQVVDSFSVANSIGTGYSMQSAIDENQRVYVFADFKIGGSPIAILRMSEDQGQHWATLKQFDGYVGGLATSKGGTLLVSTSKGKFFNTTEITTQSSSDGGKIWTVLEDLKN